MQVNNSTQQSQRTNNNQLNNKTSNNQSKLNKKQTQNTNQGNNSTPKQLKTQQKAKQKINQTIKQEIRKKENKKFHQLNEQQQQKNNDKKPQQEKRRTIPFKISQGECIGADSQSKIRTYICYYNDNLIEQQIFEFLKLAIQNNTKQYKQKLKEQTVQTIFKESIQNEFIRKFKTKQHQSIVHIPQKLKCKIINLDSKYANQQFIERYLYHLKYFYTYQNNLKYLNLFKSNQTVKQCSKLKLVYFYLSHQVTFQQPILNKLLQLSQGKSTQASTQTNKTNKSSQVTLTLQQTINTLLQKITYASYFQQRKLYFILYRIIANNSSLTNYDLYNNPLIKEQDKVQDKDKDKQRNRQKEKQKNHKNSVINLINKFIKKQHKYSQIKKISLALILFILYKTINENNMIEILFSKVIENIQQKHKNQNKQINMESNDKQQKNNTKIQNNKQNQQVKQNIQSQKQKDIKIKRGQLKKKDTTYNNLLMLLNNLNQQQFKKFVYQFQQICQEPNHQIQLKNHIRKLLKTLQIELLQLSTELDQKSLNKDRNIVQLQIKYTSIKELKNYTLTKLRQQTIIQNKQVLEQLRKQRQTIQQQKIYKYYEKVRQQYDKLKNLYKDYQQNKQQLEQTTTKIIQLQKRQKQQTNSNNQQLKKGVTQLKKQLQQLKNQQYTKRKMQQQYPIRIQQQYKKIKQLYNNIKQYRQNNKQIDVRFNQSYQKILNIVQKINLFKLQIHYQQSPTKINQQSPTKIQQNKSQYLSYQSINQFIINILLQQLLYIKSLNKQQIKQIFQIHQIHNFRYSQTIDYDINKNIDQYSNHFNQQKKSHQDKKYQLAQRPTNILYIVNQYHRGHRLKQIINHNWKPLYEDNHLILKLIQKLFIHQVQLAYYGFNYHIPTLQNVIIDNNQVDPTLNVNMLSFLNSTFIHSNNKQPIKKQYVQQLLPFLFEQQFKYNQKSKDYTFLKPNRIKHFLAITLFIISKRIDFFYQYDSIFTKLLQILKQDKIYKQKIIKAFEQKKQQNSTQDTIKDPILQQCKIIQKLYNLQKKNDESKQSTKKIQQITKTDIITIVKYMPHLYKQFLKQYKLSAKTKNYQKISYQNSNFHRINSFYQFIHGKQTKIQYKSIIEQYKNKQPSPLYQIFTQTLANQQKNMQNFVHWRKLYCMFFFTGAPKDKSSQQYEKHNVLQVKQSYIQKSPFLSKLCMLFDKQRQTLNLSKSIPPQIQFGLQYNINWQHFTQKYHGRWFQCFQINKQNLQYDQQVMCLANNIKMKVLSKIQPKIKELLEIINLSERIRKQLTHPVTEQIRKGIQILTQINKYQKKVHQKMRPIPKKQISGRLLQMARNHRKPQSQILQKWDQQNKKNKLPYYSREYLQRNMDQQIASIQKLLQYVQVLIKQSTEGQKYKIQDSTKDISSQSK